MTRWKLVPIEPDNKMAQAGGTPGHPNAARATWACMVRVAPEPPDEVVEKMVAGMQASEKWSSFWSEQDARELVRAALKALEGVE